MLLRQGERAGVLESDEQQMIDKVFDFSDTSARGRDGHAARHRRPAGGTHPHGRDGRRCWSASTRVYPVFGDEFDNVLGVLHVRRLFVALQNGSRGQLRSERPSMYPVHLVPETKRLGQLLTEIRRLKGHMAIVVDDGGSVAGLVTLEDLLEEIVGEIDDEFDPEDGTRSSASGPTSTGSRAACPSRGFNQRFERHLSDDDYHTVGGVVFGELGRAPQVGDSVEIDHVKFDVAAVDGSRILHSPTPPCCRSRFGPTTRTATTSW